MSKSDDRYVQYKVRLTAARVQAAAGRLAEARTALQALNADTDAAGFVEIGMHVKLALGELEAEAGQGRARLEALQKDAFGRGHFLIARKAAGQRPTTAR